MWKVDRPNYKKRGLRAKALKSFCGEAPVTKLRATFLFAANCRAPAV